MLLIIKLVIFVPYRVRGGGLLQFVGLPLHNEWRKELLSEIVKRVREIRLDLVRIEEVPAVGEATCHFTSGHTSDLILREDGNDVVIYLSGKPAIRFRNPYLTFMGRLTR